MHRCSLLQCISVGSLYPVQSPGCSCASVNRHVRLTWQQSISSALMLKTPAVALMLLSAAMLALKAEREAQQRAEEDAFRAAMMAKFAEDDRIEQLNAQRRRMKVCQPSPLLVLSNLKDCTGIDSGKIQHCTITCMSSFGALCNQLR